MKKAMKYMLLICITIISIFMMSKLSNKQTNQDTVQVYEPIEEKPDGTGLIFDDFNMNVNINDDKDSVVECIN